MQDARIVSGLKRPVRGSVLIRSAAAIWREFVEGFTPPNPAFSFFILSRLASIFTCLLALLVASPLCCCAAAKERVKEESSSCCCHGSGKKKEDKHECACATTKEPREKIPDVALPHPPVMLAPQAAAIWLPVALQGDLELRPEWVPAIPWHAPPSLRRNLLVSRTL